MAAFFLIHRWRCCRLPQPGGAFRCVAGGSIFSILFRCLWFWAIERLEIPYLAREKVAIHGKNMKKPFCSQLVAQQTQGCRTLWQIGGWREINNSPQASLRAISTRLTARNPAAFPPKLATHQSGRRDKCRLANCVNVLTMISNLQHVTFYN